MKHKIALTTLALLGAVNQAYADAPVTDGEWRGLAIVSLAATSGNSSSDTFLANIDMARLTAADKITLDAYVNEGKSTTNGVSTTTSGKEGASGRYDYNLNPSLFAFGSLGLDHDRVLEISSRVLVAAGLGDHVIKTKDTTFDIFGGVSYSDTNYQSDQTIGNVTSDRFNSTGLLLGEESSSQINESVLAKQRLEYYPGLTGDKAQLAKFTSSLNVAMSKTLALSVGLVDTYNSKVGIDQKKNDMSLFAGLSFKLGK